MIHTDDLDQYLQHWSSEQSYLLSELERETHLKTMSPNMLSGKVQGRFLSMISKSIRPNRILEIGTFTGFAAHCLSEGLSENGKLITLEADAEVLYLAQKYFDLSPLGTKIEMIHGDAMNIIPTLDEKFDLVFIDADKENYLNYYHLILPKMTAGGVILADNVLWYGKVLNEKMDKKTKALHDFNVFVTQDERVENMIIPLRDGIHYIRVK